MKEYKKPDFIKVLKKLSDILDEEEIKHEIPFCHIDKIKFNYIDIIIPDYVISYDISRIFNATEIKEKSGIVYTTIDNFDVRFILTSEKLWIYTLYYYSWNIINILVNILASNFNLNYTRFGLEYIYDNKKIKLTSNLKEIFDFFELKFHMITTGFPTDYVMFDYIESSVYFNSEDFTMKNFEIHDHYFKNNKKYYKNFIKHKPNIKYEKNLIADQLVYIDASFPKSKFLEKLSKIQVKEKFPNLKEVKKLPKEKIFKEQISQEQINKLLEDKKKEMNTKKKINIGNIHKKKDDDLTFNVE